MRRRPIPTRAAAISAAAVVVLLVVGCGSSANDSSSPELVDSTSTTTSPAIESADDEPNTSSAATETSESQEPETTEVAAAPIDNGLLLNSKTWPDFVAAVETQRAVHCAAEQHLILNQVELDDGTEIPDWTAMFDVPFGEFSAVVQRSNATDLLTVQAATAEILVAARSAGAAGGQDSVEPIATLARELLASSEDQIDVGVLLQAMAPVPDNPAKELLGLDPGCPVGLPISPLRSAVENFSGDNERFGGRGSEAGARCRANSLVETIGRALAAGEADDPLAAQLAAAFEIHDAYWADRTPDDGYAAARTAMLDALAVDSAERATAMAAAVDQLAAYRQSTPEGLILCPLDWDWQPN